MKRQPEAAGKNILTVHVRKGFEVIVGNTWSRLHRKVIAISTLAGVSDLQKTCHLQ